MKILVTGPSRPAWPVERRFYVGLREGATPVWTSPDPGDSLRPISRQAPAMKTYETIKIETPQEHTVLVTLNRPEVVNAMNTQMGLDLLDAFLDLGGRPNDQRCIVLTGAGKVFCGGGD